MGVDLPKNDKDLAALIHDHVTRERDRATYRWARWLIAHAYLQGYRMFTAAGNNGQIIWAYEMEVLPDGSKKKLLRLGEMLKQVNDVVGTLSSMRVSPVPNKGDTTLQGMRDRAAMKVILGAAVNPAQLREQQKLAALWSGMYGTAGMTCRVVDDPRVGLGLQYEAIHPRELFPFPAIGWNLGEMRGVARHRWMPIETLRTRFPKKIPAKDDAVHKLLETSSTSFGEHSPDDQRVADEGRVQDTLPSANTTSSRMNVAASKGSTLWVAVTELYLHGPHGFVDEYIVCSGGTMLHREDYRNSPVYRRIGVSRFFETGSFYGAGMFDIVFGEVREMERMAQSFVRAIEESDEYPVVIMQGGAIHERNAFQKSKRGPKIASVDMPEGWDNMKTMNPTVVAPVNVGDQNARVAEFMGAMVDRHSPSRDLAADKGRIDNATALQILQESQMKSYTVPIQNHEAMYDTVHTAGGEMLVRRLFSSPRALKPNQLSLDLAGVKINPDDGSVSFDMNAASNPLPDVGRIAVGIEQAIIGSQTTRKQEAVELWGLHADETKFVLTVIREGLDPAMDLGMERAAYDTIVRDILMLYQDGLTPGMAVPNEYSSKPTLQLRVLDEFMAGPVYRAASEEVRNAFEQYRTHLLEWSQGILPEQVPSPYEAPIAGRIGQPNVA